MANRVIKLTTRLGVLLLASLGSAVGSSATASAQVIVGADGTIYPSGPDGVFVSYQPCRSYQIDVAKTEELYPDVRKMSDGSPRARGRHRVAATPIRRSAARRAFVILSHVDLAARYRPT